MGDNGLTLYFSLAEYVEIPVGSWCEFQGERYTLLKAEDFIMHHTRNFEYTVSMSSDGARLAWYKLRNPVDRRLKFSYTATPMEHLQMLVDNLNERGSGWSVGTCITSSEKLITYNHTSCLDALMQMAETFNTEYEIDRRRISLTKVEYNKDNPLPLSYGKGNGFRPGIGRTNYENSIPVAVLYVQGGSRNIDASKYGNAELLLPKNAAIRYDGNKFEDESGFNAGNARSYITDAGGYSISRNGRIADGMEDSLDCSEIYPHRDETIKEVILVDADKHWYDIVTDTPSSLVYSKYGIGGEVPTIVFQDGELAGREFDLETDNDGNIICEIVTTENGTSGWKFQIVPSEIDGITMPGGSFIPKAGDTFRIFGIQLPYEYIADGETKSGASWEMFREGVKYLYSKEDRRFTFTGELDGIWAKKDWLNIGGKIKLGGFISFTDDRFQKDPVLIRITGIKEYINNPYSPEIELSNSTVGGTVANDLNQIESDKAAAEEMFDNSISYTKRRFRDAKETISMLEDAMLKNFTDSISPITVQTMMMLVGDESLQFRFVDSMTSPRPVIHNVTYDIEHKVLKIPEGIIQHMTLGITSVSTKDGHSSSEYKFWSLPAFESPVLDVPEKKYYVYAKVSRTDQVGVFYMSETAISMESESDVYYLLMGLLNSEYEGSRSYVSLYGFTEILPGQVTTDVLRDPDANLVIDLAHALITAKNGARINGNIYIGPGSSGLENLEEWEDKQQALEKAQEAAEKAQETADTAQETIAGWIADGVISPLEKQGLKNEVARIKADYEDVQSGYSKYGLGNPTDYNLAYAEYYNMLSDILASPEQDVPVPDNFDTIQDTYYDRWVDALEAIAAAAKEAVSQAQEDANTAQDTADEALQKANEAKDYIDNTLPEEIAEINKKLDGVVETWFYPYSPTLSNEPAATWIKDGEQEKHIGDMFLNNQEYVDDETTPDAGKAWRWEKNTSGDYFWNQVADSDAVKALQDAAKAQDTADQKRRVFVTTPYTPYDVGDMWTQGQDGDIMRCIKARATGSYTASDWDKASKYTDDTVAQDALDKAQQAQSAADAAQDAADAAQAAASQAQSAAENAAADASEANTQLSNLMSDSVITPPEKTALKQQHSDIKAEYSQIIADAQKYGVSTSAYTSAYNSADSALTKYTAASPENITVNSDYNNISAYYAARQTILNAIAAAAKKVADDAQIAADAAQDAADSAQDTANQAAQDASKAMQDAAAAQAAVQSVQGDLNNLNDTVSDLDEYIDGAFRDGVIDSAESIAIQKYLNVVNESWSDVQGSYTTVYNNPYLTGSAKTNLNIAYNNISQRKSTLVSQINTAVSNPSTTNISNMNSAFDSYNTAMQQFRVELENANKFISDAIRDTAQQAQDAADAAQDAADAAQSAAQQAKEDAQDAQDRLDDWASDSYISPPEKPAIKDEITRIAYDYSQIHAGCDEYGLGTPTSFDNAYNTYRNQLVALSASSPENISIPSNFRSNQEAYYNQRSVWLNKIAAAAKTVVDNIAIGVTNIVKDGRLNISSATAYLVATIRLHKNLVAGQTYTAVMSGQARGSNVLRIFESLSVTTQGSFVLKSGRIYTAKFKYTPYSNAGKVSTDSILRIYNQPQASAASNPADIDWICIYEGDVTAPDIYMEAPEDMLAGGVNLIKNSKLDNADGWAFNTGGSIVEFGGYTCLKVTTSGQGLYTGRNQNAANVPTSGYITNSIDVYATSACTISVGVENVSGTNIQITELNKWVRVHGTQNLNGNANSYVIYATGSISNPIYLKNVQCENGRYATAWKASPDDIQQRFSDLEYLETVFPNSNLVAGGALIGNMAVVTDKDPKVYDDAKVVAGLNGTTTGSDTTYGKALIFAGSNGVTDSAIKNSTTIIYESGRIKSKDVDLEGKINAKSGEIGGFVISDGFTSTIENNDKTTTSVGITSSAISLNNTGYQDYESTFWAKAYPSSLVGTKDNTYVVISQDRVAASLYGKYVKNVALSISADGASTGVHLTNGTDPPYRFDGNFAIRCPRGMFAGFRPMVRQIPGVAGTSFYEQENYLTIDDCVIICRGTNLSMDIYLPGSTSPSSDYYLQNGQCYQIWNNGSVKRIIHAQGGKRINWSGIQTGTTQTLESNDYRVIHLIYSSEANLWMMFAPPHEL